MKIGGQLFDALLKYHVIITARSRLFVYRLLRYCVFRSSHRDCQRRWKHSKDHSAASAATAARSAVPDSENSEWSESAHFAESLGLVAAGRRRAGSAHSQTRGATAANIAASDPAFQRSHGYQK